LQQFARRFNEETVRLHLHATGMAKSLFKVDAQKMKKIFGDLIKYIERLIKYSIFKFV